MSNILDACKYLAHIHGYFTLTALSIKMGLDELNLLDELSKLDQVMLIDRVIFMKSFSEYCELGTLNLCILSLLHNLANIDNVIARERVIFAIKFLNPDLNDFLN